jgi:integrase/recombinase XerD
VLSQEEVRSILKLVRVPVYRMALTLIYACGLRISEAARLETRDIDGKRHLILVREGKGGRDRYVPLHQRPLELLREYYRTYAGPRATGISPQMPCNGRSRTRCVKAASRSG